MHQQVAICVYLVLSKYNLLTGSYHVIGLAYKFLMTLLQPSGLWEDLLHTKVYEEQTKNHLDTGSFWGFQNDFYSLTQNLGGCFLVKLMSLIKNGKQLSSQRFWKYLQQVNLQACHQFLRIAVWWFSVRLVCYQLTWVKDLTKLYLLLQHLTIKCFKSSSSCCLQLHQGEGKATANAV